MTKAVNFKTVQFYKSSMELWLKDNSIEIYWIYTERKSVAGERFIRTLKNNIYKYMTAISKNVYINKLPELVK